MDGLKRVLSFRNVSISVQSENCGHQENSRCSERTDEKLLESLPSARTRSRERKGVPHSGEGSMLKLMRMGTIQTSFFVFVSLLFVFVR